MSRISEMKKITEFRLTAIRKSLAPELLQVQHDIDVSGVASEVRTSLVIQCMSQEL